MPAIVLLHGWGMRPTVFDPIAAILAPHYSVHALLLPGYGGEPLVSPYDLDHLAADVAARAPERCSVLGWSLGAQVALVWARARPEDIERLVLVSATPCFVRRDDWSAAMPVSDFDAFSAAVRDDAQAGLRRFVSLQAQGDDSAMHVARKLRGALPAVTSVDREALEGGLRILRESDVREALGTIETPALVVHGERDRLVPAEAAQYLASALPHAELSLVPGAAHAPFVTDSHGVARCMLEFLDAR